MEGGLVNGKGMIVHFMFRQSCNYLVQGHCWVEREAKIHKNI